MGAKSGSTALLGVRRGEAAALSAANSAAKPLGEERRTCTIDSSTHQALVTIPSRKSYIHEFREVQRELQGELLTEEPGKEDEKRRTGKLRRRIKGERSMEKASGLERAGDHETAPRLELTVEEEEVKRAFVKMQLERRGLEEGEPGRKSRGTGKRGDKKRRRGEKIVLKSKDIKQFM